MNTVNNQDSYLCSPTFSSYKALHIILNNITVFAIKLCFICRATTKLALILHAQLGIDITLDQY